MFSLTRGWVFESGEREKESKKEKYIIPSLQRSNAGFYQCVVRNRMGALMQKKAEVQVAYMGNFVEGDQRKTVSQGKAAVLNSPVVSSYPRPEVTWFRDGYKIIPSGRIGEELPLPEPRGEELPLPEPRGEELPLPEPRGEELPLPEPRGEELPLPEPRGEELPLPEPRGEELPLPEPRGEELPLPEPRGEELPLPEPRGEELPLPEPRGEELPLPEPRGEELPLPEPRGEEAHTSTTAPTTTPTVQFGAAASSPSTFAPGHPAGLPRPPCAGPGAQESAALATALPLVPCSALPEHPDVAGLLPDVAIAPPVRCFAPPG
ncbi:UNVERIFIED_CONTAM: hypothetical protein FKN15_038667 [Acipenser sinensis]